MPNGFHRLGGKEEKAYTAELFFALHVLLDVMDIISGPKTAIILIR